MNVQATGIAFLVTYMKLRHRLRGETTIKQLLITMMPSIAIPLQLILFSRTHTWARLS